eukprot:1315911-Amorphochlora_amoeboformis.AAC.2
MYQAPFPVSCPELEIFLSYPFVWARRLLTAGHAPIASALWLWSLLVFARITRTRGVTRGVTNSSQSSMSAESRG